MFVIRKATFAAALVAALLSACAGGAQQAVTPLTDVQFQRVFEAARSPNDAFQEDKNLTTILERTDLTLDSLVSGTLPMGAIYNSNLAGWTFSFAMRWDGSTLTDGSGRSVSRLTPITLRIVLMALIP